MSTVTVTHTSALSRVGHALSDDTRTGILLALRHGPARPSDLARQLDVSKQVMSNQLACLRGCGLVASTPRGATSGIHWLTPNWVTPSVSYSSWWSPSIRPVVRRTGAPAHDRLGPGGLRRHLAGSPGAHGLDTP